MRVLLFFAAVIATAYSFPPKPSVFDRHRLDLQGIHHIQSSSSSSEEAPKGRLLGLMSSSSEELKHQARFEPLHQQGLKSSSSSSEEKQPLHLAREVYHSGLQSGLKSSSSSEEIHHGISPVIQHERLRRDLLAHSKVSSSSSSEEKRPLYVARELYRSGLQSGLKSSSSSEEIHHGINPIIQHQRLRRDLLGRDFWPLRGLDGMDQIHQNVKSSSSSSEEIKHPNQRLYWSRELGLDGLHQIHQNVKSSSSSSEEQKHPIQQRFLGFFESAEKVAKARDELHKIQHFEHVSSSKERFGGASMPGPTVLEGTYHVAYDPPTVVQAPVIA